MKSFLVAFALLPVLIPAQGTKADYDRANGFRQRFQGGVLNDRITPNWISGTSKFWYIKQGQNATRSYVIIDPERKEKRAAFDHGRLTSALAALVGRELDPAKLAIAQIAFSADLKTMKFRFDNKDYEVNLTSYLVKPGSFDLANGGLKAFPPEAPARNDGSGEQTAIRFVNQSHETLVISWLADDVRPVEYARIEAGKEWESSTFSGHIWLVSRINGERLATYAAERRASVAILDGKKVPFTAPRQNFNTSPDGKWRIRFQDQNAILINDASKEETKISTDGSASNAYQGRVFWAPNSQKVVLAQVEPEEQHPLNIVLTTPTNQFQPRLTTRQYLKPGDKTAKQRFRIYDIESKKLTPVDDKLYHHEFDLDGERWLDNDTFVFRYNQRGHQIMRLIAVDAKTAEARSLITEETKTFIDWTNKTFYQILDGAKEAIWMSERSGWNHLYLYDLADGSAKPITQGEWVVRSVVEVDQKAKQIWFMASGFADASDPYYLHLCRVKFDGTGFVKLTSYDATHSTEFSPDRKVIFDTFSRVDLPPSFQVLDANTGKVLVDGETADVTGLLKNGYRFPERFSAKGRDGKTDIFGLVYLPTNYDPTRKYPVIEDIYAGPHGSFVPKTFHTYAGGMALAELGFIVVRIDGMGTSNRSKAFHDVCFKNIVDAGFPDRILWMKAAAKKWTSMDLDRVGIYGTSAGGQNALHAVLTQGDFYKAAVADCGCYDNRMDKIWWNEQWMSWPIGPHYEAQSGRTLAKNLTGKLLLMVGENDTNVDPASTYQLVDALIQANKDFEFIAMPNVGHGAAGTPYGRRRLMDFFVRNLLGVEPRLK
ncbi:MAG TPA: DPP IV N-terminal domain-containing protein [Fimbriimonas sp.]|nr:DPP IV N-terminal domain-containing protein [Fimbriimonas sp.]